MTALWMILTLVLPALLGWLLSLSIIRFIRKGSWFRQIDFLSIGHLVEKELLSPKFLQEKLLSPENYQKLVPQVESHIDHFLRVRLKEDMPVVGSMIGDRTINQMKGIFLKEMEQLFPEVMEGYLTNMKGDNTIGELLSKKLTENKGTIIHQFTESILKQHAIRLQIVGLVAGFAFGVLQIVIYFLSPA